MFADRGVVVGCGCVAAYGVSVGRIYAPARGVGMGCDRVGMLATCYDRVGMIALFMIAPGYLRSLRDRSAGTGRPGWRGSDRNPLP